MVIFIIDYSLCYDKLLFWIRFSLASHNMNNIFFLNKLRCRFIKLLLDNMDTHTIHFCFSSTISLIFSLLFSYEWDGLRTPIAMDVKRTNFQLVNIKSPQEAGDYYLIPDIVYEGKRWAQIKEKFKYNIK